ncbi:MAG: hypothetical protein LRY55_07505, partial [Leadbetterella sp.]|nr:hypothetical protein [Leadbetterella sp.]
DWRPSEEERIPVGFTLFTLGALGCVFTIRRGQKAVEKFEALQEKTAKDIENLTAEKERLERIAKNRPGSPCVKKFLVSNTEFTREPLCTASRQYQSLKIRQLKEQEPEGEALQKKLTEVMEKTCLCEGLSTAAYITHGVLKPRESRAVAICPGPNLAYFSRVFSLEEMVRHIYGKLNLLGNIPRSNVFINELKLYVDYLRKDISNNMKKATSLSKFRDQLQHGIDYYKALIPHIYNQTEAYRQK